MTSFGLKIAEPRSWRTWRHTPPKIPNSKPRREGGSGLWGHARGGGGGGIVHKILNIQCFHYQAVTGNNYRLN